MCKGVFYRGSNRGVTLCFGFQYFHLRDDSESIVIMLRGNDLMNDPGEEDKSLLAFLIFGILIEELTGSAVGFAEKLIIFIGHDRHVVHMFLS